MLNILQNWVDQNEFTQRELEQLLTEVLARPQLATAFNINQKNGLQKLQKRANLFLKVSQDILQVCYNLNLTNLDYNLTTLWHLWLPLALQLAEEQDKLRRTLIQGILGGQGTGKTTLTGIINIILRHLGKTTIDISIDDLYKTYQERQQLQQKDPRLIWRGPPGTHDIKLGINILEKLRQKKSSEPILIPRFDKSAYNGAGDRDQPELIEEADIVLFEGWFVGVRPVNESVFDNPPDPIITLEDKQFALDSNQRLREYLPLWEKLDRLIVIYPEDYHLSKQWRTEAEHKMIALGKTGMNDEQINKFVEYFWRSLHPELFIKPLIKNPNLTNLVIEIKPDHTPGKIYKPE